MATTQQNIVALAGTPPSMIAATPSSAASAQSAGIGTVVDKTSTDFSKDAYAKHGGFTLNLLVSTPQTADLTAIGSQTIFAGDVSFATWNQIVFHNAGAHDVIVSPGGSNPLRTLIAGTTPTFTVAAGTTVAWSHAAGLVVDSTHKTLSFDPGANTATISVSVAGS